MAKQQKRWVYSPRKPAAPKVPDTVKRNVEAQANELIETTLKPRHVQPPPEEPQFNYIVDIYRLSYKGGYFQNSRSIITYL